MLLNKIKQWLYDNEKIDCYSITIIINKNFHDMAHLRKEINVTHNQYPNARLIKKLFEDEIKITILKNKIYNANVFISINARIGTFKRKDIK